MSELTTAQHIAADRERITKLKAELNSQIADIRSKIEDLDIELHAISAYEKAKSGRSSTSAIGTRAPRGSHKETILSLLTSTGGLAPKEIKAKLGDSTPKGLHTLLGNLKKQGKIKESSGRYTVTGN